MAGILKISQEYSLETPPETGVVYRVEYRPGDRQLYTVERVEPYTRQDNQPAYIIHWLTMCLQCGAAVRFTMGMHGLIATRRCQPCAAARRRRRGWSRGPVEPPVWSRRHRKLVNF